MKIVVITGSPRKNGNSFAMTESFIKATEQHGDTIQRFDAAMLKIGGCHACIDHCGQQPHTPTIFIGTDQSTQVDRQPGGPSQMKCMAQLGQ